MADTLINGESYSWVKITFGFLNNFNIKGVGAINYKRKKTITNNYMAGEEPSSQGEGKAEYECGITLEETEVRRILKNLPAGFPRQLSAIPPFTVSVSFRRGTKLTTDRVLNWRFLEDGVDAKEGDTNIVRAVASICAGIDFGIEQ